MIAIMIAIYSSSNSTTNLGSVDKNFNVTILKGTVKLSKIVSKRAIF